MAILSKTHTLEILAAVMAVAGLAWLAWPAPVPVDLAAVRRASMEVTVDEEARTRIRRVYTVSAPLTGVVLKPQLDVGDQVKMGETVVAVMRSAGASFHDPRLHRELQSALAAVESTITLAEAERRRISAALSYSRSELTRMQSLAEQGAVARSALDKANADVKMNEAALARATAELQVRRNERESAAARLENPAGTTSPSSEPGCCVQIVAPVSGKVLKRLEESEVVVQAGTPLIEIGDVQDLEVVAELLSSDAVRVLPGQSVHIDGWGGAPIEGRVRRVEPAGFLKVSALGIEEQRVRTIIDLIEPPSQWRNLGHDYRVIVHVVTWKGDPVLTVPIGALFRVNEKWAVLRDDRGRARTVEITVGHLNNRVAEILDGLSEHDHVVLHPGDRVGDGTRIRQRK